MGEKIQQLGKASGLSQEQLEEQLNVSRQSVSKWELNDSVPEMDKIVLLSGIFTVTTDSLLKDGGGEDGGREPSYNLIERIAKENAANKQTAPGFWIMITGLVMLVSELAFLPVYGWIHKDVVDGQGFYSDAVQYAPVQTMPAILSLTAIIAATGVCLAVTGCLSIFRSRKKEHKYLFYYIEKGAVMQKTYKASARDYIRALDGIERKTLVYGEHTLLTEFKLEGGKTLPLHSHPEEQTGYLVSGHIVLTIGAEEFDMLPGDAWAIPGGVPHSARIIVDSVALEVFSPVRQDYLP